MLWLIILLVVLILYENFEQAKKEDLLYCRLVNNRDNEGINLLHGIKSNASTSFWLQLVIVAILWIYY